MKFVWYLLFVANAAFCVWLRAISDDHISTELIFKNSLILHKEKTKEINV